MCKVPYSPGGGGGDIMAAGKNITWKKGKGGSNITFHIILRLLGIISGGEKGKGTVISGGRNQDFKKMGGGRISSCREHYIPLYGSFPKWI